MGCRIVSKDSCQAQSVLHSCVNGRQSRQSHLSQCVMGSKMSCQVVLRLGMAMGCLRFATFILLCLVHTNPVFSVFFACFLRIALIDRSILIGGFSSEDKNHAPY